MSGDLPNVTVNKVQSNTGTVIPGSIVGAIIAPAYTGTQNLPAQYTRPADLLSTFQEGPLTEYGTYLQDTAKIPCLAMRPVTSTSPAYGAMVNTIGGTAVPSFGSAALIADDYNVKGNTGLFGFVMTIKNGGALGTPGITYTLSFDGGLSTGPALALGSALTISPTIPVTGQDSGIRVTLGIATATYLAGDVISFPTTGARMTTGDLAASLTALGATKQPWDLVLIHGETSPTFVSQLDTWLTGLEGKGIFNTALINTRFKNQIAGESEATYIAAMGTLLAGSSSIRLCPGADGGAVTSTLSGITKGLPTSLAILARAESISVGVDPAEVDLGPIVGFDVDDQFSNPEYHDEQVFPGLNVLRLSALRSFQGPGAPTGVFINNANLLSSPGSDFIYLQHARVMNLACATAYAVFANLLSQGIRVNPATGFILELQAAKWESIGQNAANKVVGGQCSGVVVTVSRTDNISGNGPQTITVTVRILPFKYVKTFAVTAEFVNVLS